MNSQITKAVRFWGLMLAVVTTALGLTATIAGADFGFSGTGGGGGGSTGSSIKTGTYASIPSCTTSGNMYYATDGHTPWLCNGSAWEPLVQGVVGAPPPSTATFGTFNGGSGTATWTNNAGAIQLLGVNDGTTYFVYHGLIQPTSSTSATVEAAVQLDTNVQSGPSSTDIGVGVVMVDTVHAQGLACMALLSLASHMPYWECDPMTSYTTRGSTQGGAFQAYNGPMFLRMRRNTSNIYFDLSQDRQTWLQQVQIALSSVFTTSGAPNNLGLVTVSTSTQSRGFVLSYLANP